MLKLDSGETPASNAGIGVRVSFRTISENGVGVGRYTNARAVVGGAFHSNYFLL